MSENLYHPTLATFFIKEFTHFAEIDNLLKNNLEWTSKDEISISILPIIDQVPFKKRGIARVFLLNTGEEAKTVKLSYKTCSWENELRKYKHLVNLKKIIINPGEVWFRDIAFTNNRIKQGNNYFEIVVQFSDAKEKKVFSTYIEYTQIRPIDDYKHLKRTNFLGLTSKAYVNPYRINYWVYYSLYGGREYTQEPTYFILGKILLFGISTTLLVLSLSSRFLPAYVLPISIILGLISFFSFFSNVDKHIVEELHALDLSKTKRKGGIEFIPHIATNWFSDYAINDLNYYYNAETNTFAWRSSTNRKYKNMAIEIAQKLNIELRIKEGNKEEEDRMIEMRERKERGQPKLPAKQTRNDEEGEGIRFNNNIAIGL
ncbi:MAG: hypothetical protein ACTSPI_15450, partial [Candidatus Heimdallarchaeaceae archaeon]